MSEQTMRGGHREGSGRKKVEGSRHMYTVADDVHEWIMNNGAGDYITKLIRVIMATSTKQ